MLVAAILGDTVNYWIGHRIGPKIFSRESSIFFRKNDLIRAERFYSKHGGKTIIIARFLPIIRTFAPFVAGVGNMSYRKFILFNVVGAVLWVTLFVFGGYGVGNIPFVKDNFHYAILIIIVLSLVPGIYHYIQGKRKKDPVAPPPGAQP